VILQKYLSAANRSAYRCSSTLLIHSLIIQINDARLYCAYYHSIIRQFTGVPADAVPIGSAGKAVR